MKNLLLIVGLCIGLGSIAQQAELKLDSNYQYVEWKSKRFQSKAVGDTLYYEDFDSTGNSANNFLPPGWTTTDSTNNGFDFIWSDQPPGGQYSTAVPALNSPTGSNGFLSHPSDAYQTPSPASGFTPMYAIVESGPISIRPSRSVIIEFVTSNRRCCAPGGDISLEVSVNGVNYTQLIDLGSVYGPSRILQDQLISVDASSVLANQSVAYIRFKYYQHSHFYWLIDDLTLLEGPVNAYRVNELDLGILDSFDFNPTYTQYPFALMDSISVEGVVENFGSADQTGFRVDYNVFQDSALSGSAGQGIIFQDSFLLSQPFPSQSLDTVYFNQPKFKPNTTGFYRFQLALSSDSVNQVPLNEIGELSLIISDSVLARDRGENVFVGGAGPDNYVGGGNDGDRWGVLFSVGGQGEFINSLSIYVANDPDVVGSTIVPKIWGFEQDSATLTAAMSNNQLTGNPITINASMLGTWIHLPFNNTHGNRFINAGKQYVMGWEQTAGAANGDVFLAARDRLSESYAPAVTNFVYLNDATPGWGWVTQVAAVRANFRPALVGLETQEAESKVLIFPNPSKGTIQIDIQQEQFDRIDIYDLNGKLVHTQVVALNRGNQTLNLNHLEKAVYILELSGPNSRLSKKLILH